MLGNSRGKLVGATLAVSMLAGGGAAVAATDSPTRSGSVVVAADSPGRASLVRTERSATRYTDAQVLRFLVLAEGKIAADHPQLAPSLGFTPASAEVDRAAADRLMADYLAATPDFHGRVSVPVQSGDPKRVDAALERFATSFNAYVKALYQQDMVKSEGEVSTQGWVYTATWAVTAGWVLAAAGAVVYGAVAGFHAGVAVTVIVYVYLPGIEGAPTSIERDTMVHSITTTLG